MSILVDGSLNLNEVNDEIDTHFESEDFESIGGLVLGEFSGVPKIKDKIEFPRSYNYYRKDA